MPTPIYRLRHNLRRLRRDERGFTLVFFAVSLPVLLGLVGLAIDVGQLYALDTQLAASADAAALSAANRLDRSDGAIEAARQSAEALSDGARIAGVKTLGFKFRFARTLDELRVSPTYTLADVEGAEAAFVEVTSERRSMTASFLQFVGAKPVEVQRRAVAMSQYYACDVTPLLMCQRDPDRFIATAAKGHQYRLRHAADRSDGSLLAFDAPGDDNGRNTPLALATNHPAFCYTDAIKVRPNIAIPQFDEAINIRFDRYVNATGPITPELAVFAPAPSVIKGQRYNTCFSPPNSGDFNPPYHLPRDSAFRTLTTAFAYDAGTGDWKSSAAYGGSGSSARTALDEYVYWNHADKTPIFRGTLLSSASRYELYLKELGLDESRDSTPVSTFTSSLENTLPTGGPKVGPFRLSSEISTPRCYRGPQPANEARRRIIYAAVADCSDIENFEKIGTSARFSMSVAKFFITEPARSGFVLVEFQKILKPLSDDGKLRHIVELIATD